MKNTFSSVPSLSFQRYQFNSVQATWLRHNCTHHGHETCQDTLGSKCDYKIKSTADYNLMNFGFKGKDKSSMMGQVRRDTSCLLGGRSPLGIIQYFSFCGGQVLTRFLALWDHNRGSFCHAKVLAVTIIFDAFSQAEIYFIVCSWINRLIKVLFLVVSF